MRFTWLVTILILLQSCEVEQSEKSYSTNREECFNNVNPSKWRKEILEVDSLKIDGLIPFVSDRSTILKKFGNPDRISKKNGNNTFLNILVRDEYLDVQEMIYGSSIFETKGQVAIFTLIDFESTDVEIIHPKITLKRNLKIEEICILFPESCKLMLLAGNLWSGHIELRASDSTLDSRRLYLVFRNEKLVKVLVNNFSFM